MLELGPIFRALLRNKTGALLIACQMALTLAVMVNAIFMIQDRNRLIERASGIDEANTFHLENIIFGQAYNQQQALARDLDLLRKTPGVVGATQINEIPLSGRGAWWALASMPGADQNEINAGAYMVDEQGLAALGVELIAGENFTAADIEWHPANSTALPVKAILSRQLAEKLFDAPWQQAPGKTIYTEKTAAIRVVGVIDRLQSGWPSWANTEYVVLLPRQLEGSHSRYFIRTEPGRRDELMPQLEKKLAEADQQRIIREVTTMTQTRQDSYRKESATNQILFSVIVVLILITGFGIVGLAMFSINRRVRVIGTRRALGATRSQIVRHFMLENLLISSLGVVLGVIGAVVLNIWLVNTLSVGRLGLDLLVFGVLALLFIGQLAVSYPAYLAARIAPATATRG